MESWNIFSNAFQYKERLVDQKKIQKELGLKSSDPPNEYNVDNKCQFDSMWNDRIKMKDKIYDYFKKYCQGNQACHIDLDIHLPFFDELTCECRDRITKKQTSNTMGLFYTCSSEIVGFQFGAAIMNDPTRLDYEFHRTLALAWYYLIDFIGILFMIRAVMGLNKINNQKHLKI